MKKNFKYILLVLFLFFCFAGYGQINPSEIQNPKDLGLDNWVSNQDNILSDLAVEEINNKINVLYDSTSTQISVVVIKGDKQTSARDLSMDLFDLWKIGNIEMDNGLLILVATQAHQCFIRTGYGLEGCLTDAITTNIFNTQMKPLFKENKWEEGIIAGLDACLGVIYEEYNSYSTKKSTSNSIPNSTAFYIYILIGCLVFICAITNLLSVFDKAKKDIYRTEAYHILKDKFKTWAILLFFLGIWWIPILYVCYKYLLKRVRYKAIKCTCGHNMCLLSEKQEDKYLSETEQFEETLSSRDYDVWLCNNCGKIRVYAYEKKNSYSVCPICNTKALKIVSSQTVGQPTHYKNGIERTEYVCKRCGHKKYVDKTIPKLINTAPIFVGGMLGGSGSVSGRGFSGGGFGGGMSGGGGGGGSW